jgi:hypothetical protein
MLINIKKKLDDHCEHDAIVQSGSKVKLVKYGRDITISVIGLATILLTAYLTYKGII